MTNSSERRVLRIDASKWEFQSCFRLQNRGNRLRRQLLANMSTMIQLLSTVWKNDTDAVSRDPWFLFPRIKIEKKIRIMEERRESWGSVPISTGLPSVTTGSSYKRPITRASSPTRSVFGYLPSQFVVPRDVLLPVSFLSVLSSVLVASSKISRGPNKTGLKIFLLDFDLES